MMPVVGDYTDPDHLNYQPGGEAKELSREHATAFPPVERSEEWPSVCPHNNVVPPAVPVFHVTSPVKNMDVYVPFSWSQAYGDLEASECESGRIAWTTASLKKRKVDLPCVMAQLGGSRAGSWDFDMSTRWNPFGDDVTLANSASLVADLPSGVGRGIRAPVYWCCLGSTRISAYLPIFIPGKIPLSLTGAGGAKTPWDLCDQLEDLIDTKPITVQDQIKKKVKTDCIEFQEEMYEVGFAAAQEIQIFMDHGDPAGAEKYASDVMAKRATELMDLLDVFVRKFQ